MEVQEKNALLDKLSVCYNNARYLKTLAEENHAAPALIDQLSANINLLKETIDGLLRDAYENWRHAAQGLTAALMKNNVTLENSIAEIERHVALAQNIVKATSSLDDIITVGKQLLSK
jgi:hypothetical protein